MEVFLQVHSCGLSLQTVYLGSLHYKMENKKGSCALMGCDVGNLQSLEEVIEDTTNEIDIINQAKLLLKMGFKKDDKFCQECFWK